MQFANIQRIFLAAILFLILVQVASATSTLTVAAHDSTSDEKANAYFTCDGTEDQIEINKALSTVGPGGTVQLSSGTFNCNRGVQSPNFTKLKGIGNTLTILNFINPQYGIGTNPDVSGITLSDLKIIGKGFVQIMSSNNRVVNVTVYDVDNSYFAAFTINSLGYTIENVSFINCNAIDVDRDGFLNVGAHDPNWIRDITYIGCQAINCGRFDQENEYNVGFNIVEGANVADIILSGCLAEGNWEAGFYGEFINKKINVRMINCTSRNNGQNPNTLYGSGFLISGGMHCENCIAENNAMYGYQIHMAEGTNLINCSEIGNKLMGYIIYGISDPRGIHIISSKSYGSPHPVWFDGLASRNISIENMEINSGPLQINADAIHITSSNWNIDEIYIVDSLIQGYNVGIYNEAVDKRPTAYNVTVEGAINPYVNVNVKPVSSPDANFTVNMTTGDTPLTVRFTDTSAGNPTSWSWSFGDGTTSTEQHPAHTYSAAGTYTVTLTAGNTAGTDLHEAAGLIRALMRGDFNQNDRIDIGDVTMVASMVADHIDDNPRADFNGNGYVDVGDAAKIRYFSAGLIETL